MAKLTRAYPSSSLSGITLIEVLVVFAICGMLALLLLPLTVKVRASARGVVCCNNLRGLGQAYITGLLESSGALPDIYYRFQANGPGIYQVALRAPEAGSSCQPGEAGDLMVCPFDDAPRTVAPGVTGIAGRHPRSSYGYNVNLPLSFKNVSRVPFPVDTVTFFDGDVSAILGNWEYIPGWQGRAIRDRHASSANYLYLDGHVEKRGSFSDVAFNWSTFAATNDPVASSTPMSTSASTPSAPPTPPTPLESTTYIVSGAIPIDPNNNVTSEFRLTLSDGTVVMRDNLHADTCYAPHAGFSLTGLEYSGPAADMLIRPKSAGNISGLFVNNLPYTLKTNNLYEFSASGNDMTVHLYNEKRNAKGKPAGRWYIEITGNNITINVSE